ncbi:alkene reductase [Entomobacter blattae]|uniref:N-ethylmaleimide reductase n=1 Tax=Entomobacter blattae TaxID=2762277 RepID=A0A7H1NPL0_9PROT|nr:alkene reductase [Entomobacter blattae]QNT77720.1 N-ethylmaleimide reductase [Entomobacter blattae]
MPSLFDPIQVGAISAANRIFMAPLTRGRATNEFVPTSIMVEYYAQRAGAGLIISEASPISVEGAGWPYSAGIWNDKQVEGWKPVTEAVHKAGGRIICQLWHMGRIVHPDFLDGKPGVSASATIAPDYAYTYKGKKPYERARALGVEEIPRILNDYANAAKNAMRAGFDGVQIHAANGYLIDQFLREGSNFRSDQYGGSVENRVRLLDEVTGAVVDAIGADRTAVRLSPNEPIQGVYDNKPVPLFTEAAKRLSAHKIAFLELREPGSNGTFGRGVHPPVAPDIQKAFKGPLVLNSDYTEEMGQKILDEGKADAVAYGRPFITNPDLVQRFREHLPLRPMADMKYWYGKGPESLEGYLQFS